MSNAIHFAVPGRPILGCLYRGERHRSTPNGQIRQARIRRAVQESGEFCVFFCKCRVRNLESLMINNAFLAQSFGIRPTKEQLQLAGGQCPICHDGYATPVQLICGHIFCESCVGTWFDREQTCPLCRAKVADDPSWRDGATTMFVQLY